jgi:hypothetical protein
MKMILRKEFREPLERLGRLINKNVVYEIVSHYEQNPRIRAKLFAHQEVSPYYFSIGGIPSSIQPKAEWFENV